MRISDWSSDVCSSDLVLHLLALEGDLFEMAESLAAEFLGPVDAGEARVELRLLIAAAEREVLLDAQPLARRLAEGRHPRFAQGRGPGTPGFDIPHSARSDERRVGNDCVSTCRFGWCP